MTTGSEFFPVAAGTGAGRAARRSGVALCDQFERRRLAWCRPLGGWDVARRGAVLRRVGLTVRQLEGADHAGQLARLFLQRLRCCRRFFDQRRILLRDFIHLRDGAVDFVDARALLGAGGRDFADDVGNAAYRIDHFRHGRAGLLDQLATLFHLLRGIVDECLDFLGGRRRTVRQVAHFGGHDGKAASLFPGPRRFHCRIQARMLVWKAMPSMTLMMSAILLDALSIASMVRITSPITSPPRTALSEALTAICLAWRALSEFCRTVAVSSSMAEAVSSSEPACCSVRADRSRLPAAISLEAVLMVSVPERTSATMRTRLSLISPRAVISCPTSSLEVALICTLRSPPAMVWATSMSLASEAPMRRASNRPMLATSAITVRATLTEIQRALAATVVPSAAPMLPSFSL